MTVIRPMFPSRQTDTASIVDDHLVPLKFMAEFAASLVCDDMDANGAQKGYFHIRRDEGERLAWHDRRSCTHRREERPWREADQEGEGSMKETTQAKITASVAIAKAMAQKALAPNPNPQWTEYEMRSIDEWIARQGVKLDRPEAIRRLVELGLKAKK